MAKRKIKRSPNVEWDPVFKANYRAKLLSPTNWIRVADSLLDAARVLESQVADIWKSLRQPDEVKN
jgi:hypothetical protein